MLSNNSVVSKEIQKIEWKINKNIRVKKSNLKQCCSVIVLYMNGDNAFKNPNEKAPKLQVELRLIQSDVVQ